MLEIKGLSTGYGSLEVLKDFDLRVDTGEIVAVLGHNGAGKSTLLKAISGTLKVRRGTIEWDGFGLVGKAPSVRVKAGVVHCPVGRRLFEADTVDYNLEMGAYIRTDRHGIARDMAYWKDRFPILREMENRRAGELSGGQQQVVALVRAMMSRPSMLLLDEPSMGLSPRTTDDVFRIVSELRQDGLTVLVAEQNVGKVLDLADRAVVVEGGQIVLDGKTEVLRNTDAIRRAFLGG